MKKVTVTSELRKSITKVTGRIIQQIIYSDSRKGNAVGVKVAFEKYNDDQIKAIVADMESKGFVKKYVRFNDTKNAYVCGTRFCFFNK